MIHALEVGKLFDNIKTVLVRLSVMNDDRHVQLPRQLQLFAQQDFLLLARRRGLRRTLLPIIVQTDFTNRLDPRVCRQSADDVNVCIRDADAVLRMNADRRIHEIIGMRQLHRRFGRLHITARIENQPDVVFLHGPEQYIPIRIKPTVIIVCMGIKQHICFLSYLFRIRTAVPYAITSAALAMSCEEP